MTYWGYPKSEVYFPKDCSLLAPPLHLLVITFILSVKHTRSLKHGISCLQIALPQKALDPVFIYQDWLVIPGSSWKICLTSLMCSLWQTVILFLYLLHHLLQQYYVIVHGHICYWYSNRLISCQAPFFWLAQTKPSGFLPVLSTNQFPFLTSMLTDTANSSFPIVCWNLPFPEKVLAAFYLLTNYCNVLSFFFPMLLST